MSLGNPVPSAIGEGLIIQAKAQGKLIFAAAGTTPKWMPVKKVVIWPASSPQTIAVTGVKTSWPTVKDNCERCHYGRAVDFVVPFEKSNGTLTHSLTMSGNKPSHVGGSSIATASMAGAAALVWSKFPTASASTIFNKLKSSASFSKKNSKYGYGIVDVAKAVGHVETPPFNCNIQGPSVVSAGDNVSYTATTANGTAPYSYSWYPENTSSSHLKLGNCNSPNSNRYNCTVLSNKQNGSEAVLRLTMVDKKGKSCTARIYLVDKKKDIE